MSRLKTFPKITKDCSDAFEKLSTLNIRNHQDFDALAKSVGYTDKTFIAFLKDTSYSEKTLDNYKKYVKTATSTTSEFGATFKSLLANIGITLGLNLVITSIEKIAQASQKAAQNAQELSEESTTNAQALAELKEQLATGEQSTTELTNAFKEQLKTMGYTGTEIDTLIQKYGGLSGAMNEATRKAWEDAKTKAHTNVSISGDSLVDTAKKQYVAYDRKEESKNETLTKQIDKVMKKVAIKTYDENHQVVWTSLDYSADGILEFYDALQKVSQLIQETSSETGDKSLLDLSTLTSTTVYGEVSNTLNTLQESAESYRNAIDQLHNADSQLVLADYLKTNSIQTQEDLDAYIQTIQGIAEYSAEYKQVLTNTAKEVFPQFTASANNTSSAVNTVTDAINNLATSLDELSNASAVISHISNAFKELSDNGYITTDTILNIEESTGKLVPNWEEYKKELLATTAGSKDLDTILTELTYTALEVELGIEKLANADEEYITAILRENGVLNANESALYIINKASEKLKTEKYYLEVAGKKLNNAISSEVIPEILAEAEAAGVASLEIARLRLEEINLNRTEINTTEEIQQLIALANTARATSTTLKQLDELQSILGTGKHANELLDPTSKYYDPHATKEYYNKLGQLSFEYEELDSDDFVVDYSNNDNSSSTKESFNWIETALSRIQRTISNLGKTVSATYKSWGERNSALAQQMSTVSHEIDLQNQAYQKYMSLANSVSLSEGYKQLVREGAIRYDDESIDSDTATKIKEYQEYYEAALAAEDARIDLESEQMNLIQTNFDNIAKQYDDQLSLMEHEVNSLNSSIDMIEKEGHVVTEDLYTSLIQNADKQMSLLQNKAIELQSAMSGVATGTEMWYSLNSQLLSIEEEMDSLKSSTIEWNNSLRDLEWENFDRILEKMAAVNSEADFLMELLADEDMYNDDGSITDAGRATMGLHATNYNSKMAQASEISKELRALDSDYANDSENLTYLERRNELEQQYRDLILDAKDDEQSLIDMQKEQYDALLDHMSKVIDKRKDMLSKAKDAYDYEKNISEQTEEVAKLEKQLSAYQGDTSEESRTTVQQLKVSLADAKENLEETQYEKYINDQEQMLDSLYDETEEWLNARLDNVDLLIQNVISSADSNAQAIIATLQNANISMDALPNFEELIQHIPSATQTIESVNNTQLQEPTTTTNNNVVNHNTFEFNLPNVTNGEETITYLQHSKRFENIIHEIAFGNGSFGKYKY